MRVAHENRGKTPSSAPSRRLGGPLDAGRAKRVCPGGSMTEAADVMDEQDVEPELPTSCVQPTPGCDSLTSGASAQSPKKAGSSPLQIPPPPPEPQPPGESQLQADLSQGSAAAEPGETFEEADAHTLQDVPDFWVPSTSAMSPGGEV